MDLGKNGIGVKGITQLFEVLKNNDTVQTLLLEINNIGDQGAELIAKHLAGSILSLRYVNLCMSSETIQKGPWSRTKCLH